MAQIIFAAFACVFSLLAALGWFFALRLAAERPATRQMRMQAASGNRLSETPHIRRAMAYTGEES